MSQRRIKAKAKREELGPTGRFPRGHLDATDEGELAMGIGADVRNGVVRIDFGKPTAWIGLPPQAARDLAALLIKHAETLESSPSPRLPS